MKSPISSGFFARTETNIPANSTPPTPACYATALATSAIFSSTPLLAGWLRSRPIDVCAKLLRLYGLCVLLEIFGASFLCN